MVIVVCSPYTAHTVSNLVSINALVGGYLPPNSHTKSAIFYFAPMSILLGSKINSLREKSLQRSQPAYSYTLLPRLIPKLIQVSNEWMLALGQAFLIRRFSRRSCLKTAISVAWAVRAEIVTLVQIQIVAEKLLLPL